MYGYPGRVLIERSMHSGWLSNTYLVADKPGGVAVFIDSGGPMQPLEEVVQRENLTVTHILRTHGHGDHVAHEAETAERFGVPVLTTGVSTGGLDVRAIPTPGHSADGLSFVVNDEVVFTGDTLFRDAVGGGPADEVRHSVMDVLMKLSGDLRVLPGHTDETTIGREWEENPFVRFWRGVEAEDGRGCSVAGEPGRLLVWSPDYDGKGKVLVRLASGEERIVGASRVELA
jgi:glyoxylase-like metal-dependent hydrolase (beta-lactamase superfamily II)